MTQDFSGQPVNIVMDGDGLRLEAPKSKIGASGHPKNENSAGSKPEFYLDLILYKVKNVF